MPQPKRILVIEDGPTGLSRFGSIELRVRDVSREDLASAVSPAADE